MTAAKYCDTIVHYGDSTKEVRKIFRSYNSVCCAHNSENMWRESENETRCLAGDSTKIEEPTWYITSFRVTFTTSNTSSHYSPPPPASPSPPPPNRSRKRLKEFLFGTCITRRRWYTLEMTHKFQAAMVRFSTVPDPCFAVTSRPSPWKTVKS